MTGMVDIHALVGAYALDALDDIERAAFDRHLRECPSCAVEVVELRETAARLAEPVAAPAPPHLRQSVLAQISRTPQERGRPAAAVTRRAGRDRLRRWAAAGVAAAVLATGASAGTWAITNQQLVAERRETANIDAVLAAADARLVSQAVSGGRVTMVVSPSRNAAVAVLDGLEAPGKDKSYQVWMIDESASSTSAKYRNVGLTRSGAGRFYVEGVAPAFGVSKEPKAGKATTPTEVVGKLDLR
jgi:anti-sigma factor RsiW